jgi:hypothetical protein
MKKIVGLTGATLMIAAQFLSSPVFAKDDLPLITTNGLHPVSDPTSMLSRSGAKWAYAKNSKKSSREEGDGQTESIWPEDKACVRAQIEVIKTLPKLLKDYQVEIHLEYGNQLQKGNFATVKTEQDLCIPILNKPFNERKILELGVLMPYAPSGINHLASVKNPPRCMVMDEAAIVQALNHPLPSTCEKKHEEIQAKAVNHRSGDKARAAASFGGGSASGESVHSRSAE